MAYTRPSCLQDAVEVQALHPADWDHEEVLGLHQVTQTVPYKLL